MRTLVQLEHMQLKEAYCPNHFSLVLEGEDLEIEMLICNSWSRREGDV